MSGLDLTTTTRASVAIVLGTLLALTGCDNRTDEDAGTDAGMSGDGGGGTDGGIDAGRDGGGVDAGDVDAGDVDAGDLDASTTDGGPIGGGAATSAQIQAVLDATDGTVNLMIDNAIVTYVKAAVGVDVDGAGFFVQAETTGPALYVGVDPSSLTPVPAVGDVVDLRVVDRATATDGTGIVYAMSVDMWNVDSSGNDTSFLVQDLSAVDVVTDLDMYPMELVSFTGATIANDGGGCGTGFRCYQVTTTGVTTASNALRLRVTDTALAALHLRNACVVDVGPTPLWRFSTNAQPSAWDAADATVTSCPAPTVTGAVASDATTVVVTFDSDIDMASVLTDGSQFTIVDSGSAALAVTAAASTGDNTVTLTTAAQTPGETYTVTVAATVTDYLGTGVDATMNTAMFDGFVVPAVVRINELNAHITGGCDLVELRVVSGGSMAGFEVTERGSTIFTFPAGFTVATNDIVVLHTNVGSVVCRGGGTTPMPVDETTAVDAEPASNVPANYDTAFDFWSTDAGITDTDNVIAVLDAVGGFADVILASDAPTGTSAGGSETAAATAAAAGEWTMVGGGIPAGGFVDADFSANAAQDLDGTGTAATGESIQRNDDDDMNDMADWTQAASSWGVINTGQTAF